MFLIFLCTLGLCFLGNLPSIIVKVWPCLFFCFFNFLLLLQGFVLMWTISGVLIGCVWGASQVAQW